LCDVKIKITKGSSLFLTFLKLRHSVSQICHFAKYCALSSLSAYTAKTATSRLQQGREENRQDKLVAQQNCWEEGFFFVYFFAQILGRWAFCSGEILAIFWAILVEVSTDFLSGTFSCSMPSERASFLFFFKINCRRGKPSHSRAFFLIISTFFVDEPI
jgi:hypothetical protein